MDLFADAVASEEELRSIYEDPKANARAKEISGVDELAREFIACSSMVFVASFGADGRCDATPRGGPPGFVSVLDSGDVVIPDATGNRRLDTFRNVVATGRVGLVFIIPGRGQTLRVNGRACVSVRAELLAGLTAVGNPPRAALVVRPEEVFTHCPKAFVRSRVWQPESWLDASAQPDPAVIAQAHIGDPGLTVEDVRQDQIDSLRYRLA
ncbi:pyridoxamine 5'-phosphate oxidase family protein [Actinokineospora auranticolor]|uniref:MSMEG_1061 family FMN-dependent PPOX-type flavoprotein n=1 Tax=Actinokineospora auranticolor TaxID=155976 RepID=UPI000CEBC2C3|nr:MSMEG_1061 family FMN-dependent PPOX-type flavoprotein [Actinokineospora auranticolor]